MKGNTAFCCFLVAGPCVEDQSNHLKPMRNQKSLFRQTPALAVLVGLFLSFAAGDRAYAAIDTWTGGGGGSGNWQTAANWGGTAPIANDILNFANGTQLLTTNDFPVGTVFNNLVFDSSAGA